MVWCLDTEILMPVTEAILYPFLFPSRSVILYHQIRNSISLPRSPSDGCLTCDQRSCDFYRTLRTALFRIIVGAALNAFSGSLYPRWTTHKCCRNWASSDSESNDADHPMGNIHGSRRVGDRNGGEYPLYRHPGSHWWVYHPHPFA